MSTPARGDNRLRILVAVAAVVSGLVLGLVVVGLVGGGGRPGPYQPFRAGLEGRLVGIIEEDGPVCYPDPQGGARAFCLDLEGGEIVALHIVPPGGDAGCLVAWDRTAKRYVDCAGRPVDRATLRRFPVFTRPQGEEEAVFVDLRSFIVFRATTRS